MVRANWSLGQKPKMDGYSVGNVQLSILRIWKNSLDSLYSLIAAYYGLWPIKWGLNVDISLVHEHVVCRYGSVSEC